MVESCRDDDNVGVKNDKQTDRETGQTDRQTEKPDKQTDRETGQTDRETGQTDRKIGRQTNRQRNGKIFLSIFLISRNCQTLTRCPTIISSSSLDRSDFQITFQMLVITL